jgi:hypothetical protein
MFTLSALRHSPRVAKYAAAIVVAGLFAAPSAQALNIFVDQDATWRYINATSATTQTVSADWFASKF